MGRKHNKQSQFALLAQQAYSLCEYTEQMELGGYQQRALAKSILAEIEKISQLRNEWTMWQIMEASLIPKMIKLAQDINLYKNLCQAASPGRKRQNFRPRKPLTMTHQSAAYQPFERQATTELSAAERQNVELLLHNLNTELAAYKD